MDPKHPLYKIAQERVLILDGAMGSMLQTYRLDEVGYRGARFADWPQSLRGNNDLLNLTQPEIVQSIHAAYFEAGADLVETNTFNAQAISLADYGMAHLVKEINRAGAALARQAADAASTPDRPRFVAGAIGPTNRTLSLSPDVNRPGYRATTFDELVTAYQEQAEALLEGGVDALLVETVFDTLNAKAALFAVEEAFAATGKTVPILVSGTITDASGRTLSGQTTEAFLISLSHLPLLSIGLNCALGAKDLRPYLQTLAAEAPFLVSAYPNAGLPNALGGYDETPEQMADAVEEYLQLGLVNLLGGCCGTTPEHIRAFAAKAARYEPRPLPAAL